MQPQKVDLEANIMLIEGADSERILLVTIDALYVGPNLTLSLSKALNQFINPESVIIGSSHSHNAPMLDNTKPQLGAVSLSHLNFVSQLIIRESILLFRTQGIEVVPRAKQYLVGQAVSHRRAMIPIVASLKSLSLFRTHMFPSRRRVRATSEIIEFHAKDGVVQGCIWVMPCHPVSHPNPLEISSHFIGEVRQEFRGAPGVSSKATFCFFQGASGDLRPPALKRVDTQRKSWKWWLERMVQRPNQGGGYGAFSWNQYRDWIEVVKSDFFSASASDNWRITDRDFSVSSQLSSEPLARHFAFVESRAPHGRSIDFQVFQIAGLRFLAISAEPTHRVGSILRSKIPNSTVVGCISDTFGYLVSPFQEALGGYESRGFERAFSLERLRPRLPLYFAFKRLWKSIKSIS